MKELMALSDLKPSQSGRIVYIEAHGFEDLHRLMGSGLLPDVQVQVIRSDARNILFFAGSGELALSRDIAAQVLVEPAA